MSTDLATLVELKERLEWTLDAGEERAAAGALSDLSDDARFYGSTQWEMNSVPRQVKGLVLRAAARFIRNPDGFVQSRAGDETVGWGDRGDDAVTAQFTRQEQDMLAAIAGRRQGLVSAGIVAYGPTTRRAPRYIDPVSKGGTFEYLPAPTEGAPIPYFIEDGFG